MKDYDNINSVESSSTVDAATIEGYWIGLCGKVAECEEVSGKVTTVRRRANITFQTA